MRHFRRVLTKIYDWLLLNKEPDVGGNNKKMNILGTLPVLLRLCI